MHSFKGLVLAALLLFTSVHDTVGINCYACSGDSRCNDPFDKGNNSNRIVPSTDGWCWKAIGKPNGNTEVLRGAGPIIDGGQTIRCTAKTCRPETVLAGPGDFCCCNTDLCNSAGRIIITVPIFLTILFFIIRY